MQQTARKLVADAYQQAEEWHRFNAWAVESRSVSPFGELALLWHAGLLTIEEGRRIEEDQRLARFLEYIAQFLQG